MEYRLYDMLEGAGLGHLSGGCMCGGSKGSWFVARMMAENRLKNKGKYGKSVELPKNTTMEKPIKFDLKTIANSKQRKGATGPEEYGASPFLLKVFGKHKEKSRGKKKLVRNEFYTPPNYRTPVPDAPFPTQRRSRKTPEQ